MKYSIYQGSALSVLPNCAPSSIHCVVTSPPYYLHRTYGNCESYWPELVYSRFPGDSDVYHRSSGYADLGREDRVDDYIGHLIQVFRAVHRVLRDDGTVFVNIGDTYGKDGSLLGVPHRFVLAMIADGWLWRSDNVWAKGLSGEATEHGWVGSIMPEAVTDRPTRSHEYVYMFTKSRQYYYDAKAVRENGVFPAGTKAAKGSTSRAATPGVNARPPKYAVYSGTRNLRSVWTISIARNKGSHRAVFPVSLPVLCIKAGCPTGGIVLDPFMGSGTTLEAAVRYGRIGVGIDPDQGSIDEATAKLRNLVT